MTKEQLKVHVLNAGEGDSILEEINHETAHT